MELEDFIEILLATEFKMLPPKVNMIEKLKEVCTFDENEVPLQIKFSAYEWIIDEGKVDAEDYGYYNTYGFNIHIKNRDNYEAVNNNDIVRYASKYPFFFFTKYGLTVLHFIIDKIEVSDYIITITIKK